MRTASSSNLRPQALMGSAKSQPAECGDVIAFNRAWWYSDVVEVIRAARSFWMSGLSQTDCLWARDNSGTGTPDSAYHCSKPKTRGRSSCTLQQDRMEACSVTRCLRLKPKRQVMPARTHVICQGPHPE